MKKLFGLFVIVLMNLSVLANHVNIEPTLKVMAKSGLKLRLMPNLSSPIIDIVPYGSELEKTEDFVPLANKLKVNWVEGQWIKVQFNGNVGFVFDGFVSNLNVPLEDNEFSSDIDGLSYALYEWAFNNFQFEGTDTISNSEFQTTTSSILSGNQLLMYDGNTMTRVEFTIEKIRIMDAYHLLESMMDTRSARSLFKENSIFFKDSSGQLNKIKIGQDQIEVKMLESGAIKISCLSTYMGC